MEKKRKYSAIAATEKALIIAGWLEDKKATDILVLDLANEHALTEATVHATATSPRHAQGLADFIMSSCKDNKVERLRVEGQAAAQWILLDLNDVIVHIFLPEVRALYRLDELWAKAPVLLDKRSAKQE